MPSLFHLSCHALFLVLAVDLVQAQSTSPGAPNAPSSTEPASTTSQQNPDQPAGIPSATLPSKATVVPPAQPTPSIAQTGQAQQPKAAPPKSSLTAPTDPKAAKSFAEAKGLVRSRNYLFALEGFRKADKQDGGRCESCEMEAYKAAKLLGDFKAQREQAALMLEHADSPSAQLQAHYLAGVACLSEGVQDGHDKSFEAADSEFRAALALQPAEKTCLYGDALALAHLKQDGQARERFQAYLKLAPPDDVNVSRAQRFIEHPELARARVAPNFRITTLEGKTLTLEDLTGKVVLIDFWATWCGPCRNALPRVRQISQKFQGQPFIVLSVSLDKDDAKWKDFVAHNGMTWMQYRDASGEASMAKIFGVHLIPATFTIDADGILQDQHVGDADIEGKIKKLVARAAELGNHKMVAEAR